MRHSFFNPAERSEAVKKEKIIPYSVGARKRGEQRQRAYEPLKTRTSHFVQPEIAPAFHASVRFAYTDWKVDLFFVLDDKKTHEDDAEKT